ncbi:MAG TPA: diguanylate cyclase [Vicinamibacterales bacterium]|nr:diguanylate cyclase [Vicinamibacterales bacterium]
MNDGRIPYILAAARSERLADAVRGQTADLLLERSDVIVADTVAVFPSSGPQRLEADFCIRLGGAFIRLVADAIRAGRCEPRSGAIVDLIALGALRSVSVDQLFTFSYLVLSAAVDELSLDQQLGATTEPWPQVTQTLRRAVFDVLAAWTMRTVELPSAAAITDTLTTLHTRPVFEVALDKECQRAERFEHWLSLIMMDVDNLAEINRVHGYGVGDRVLERMGILTRTYFRQHDWVARYSEDSIAVLLPETGPADAALLADRTRTMVHDRLTFRDYRTDQRANVTVSVAVVSARALEGEPVDTEQFLAETERAVERAKTSGRNRVEQVEIPPRLMSIDDAAKALRLTLEGTDQLVAAGKLEPISAGRHVRLERSAVMRLAGRAGEI